MNESDEEARLFGKIAVRQQLVTQEQLAEASAERIWSGQRLGAIMLARGMIDQVQLATILALLKRHRERSERRDDPRSGGSERPSPYPDDSEWRPLRRPGQPDGRTRRAPAPIPAQPQTLSLRPTGATRGRAPLDLHREPPAQPAGRSMRQEEDASERTSSGPDSSSHPPQGSRPSASSRPSSTSRPSTTSRPPVTSRPPAGSEPPPSSRPEHASVSPDVDAAPARLRFRQLPGRPAQEVTPIVRRKSPGEVQRAYLARRRANLRAAAKPKPSSTNPAALVVGPPPVVSASPALINPAAAGDKPTEEVGVKPGAAARPRRRTLLDAAVDRSILEPLGWDVPLAANRDAEQLIELLAEAAAACASDVHIHAGMPPRVRLNGKLMPLRDMPLTAVQTEAGLRGLMSDWQCQRFDACGEMDFAYSIERIVRFRANIYQQQGGVSGVFHIVPAAVPSLEELGLPASLRRLTDYAQGLVLATGPSGSGKTSTLAALVNIINHSRSDHVLTIEDPIEYLHHSQRAIVNQRQVGRHTESFARGLRGALREDPDVICIGELRDLETISLAMSAAETGHLVFGTLHTGSAIGTINRIVGSYPPGQQPQIRSMLSESLRAIVSQRLVPLADGSGVVPALEILNITKAVSNLIRDNRTFQIASVMQTGRAHGMQTLDDALIQLLLDGRIRKEDALAHCLDPRAIERVSLGAH